MESVAAVVGAFFLFLLIFPLIGACVGFFLRILLPNLFGGVVIYLVMAAITTPTGAWWEWTVPLLAWAVLILGTRKFDHRLHPWHEGYWRAVLLAVSFGFWRFARLHPAADKKLKYSSVTGL